MARRKDLDTTAWREQAARVKQRDGYACTACGSEDDLTVDHIEPVAHSGQKAYADHELATLCRSCNGRKSDKLDVRIDYRSPRWR